MGYYIYVIKGKLENFIPDVIKNHFFNSVFF